MTKGIGQGFADVRTTREGKPMSLLMYKARVNRTKALRHLRDVATSGRKHKRPVFLLGAQYMVSCPGRAA